MTRQPLKRSRRKGRYRFTKEDCQRGYQAALAKCSTDWHLYAWFFRHNVAKRVMWRRTGCPK